MDLYSFLHEHHIRYTRYDHPPVFTCEQARRLVPTMAAAETKNLFVRDRKGRRHFLVVVGYEKSADLAALSDLLGTSRLSLGSPDRLTRFLGVEPGSVTLLALINDPEGQVSIIIDEEVWRHDALRCHPLVNTCTLAIPREDLARFMAATGHHEYRVLEVPGRTETR